MRNIDSTFDPRTNKRFVTAGLWIRKLRIICRFSSFSAACYIVFFPAAFLSVTVLAVNLLGDGLRDALDPRMAKRL